MQELRHVVLVFTFVFAGVTVASAQIGDGIGTGISNVSPVPEPNSVILMGGALVGLAALVRRRNKRKSGSPDNQQ